MSKPNYTRVFAVLCSVVCSAAFVFAQAPVPPIQDQPQPVLVTQPIETQVTPDEQPLTGGQQVGFGSWGPRHSFFTPNFRFAETLQSNPLLFGNNTGGNTDAWRGYSSLGVDGQLVKYFGRDAEIRYTGAFRYDTYAELQGSDKFTNTHDFLISKRIVFRKWQLVFDNETQYSSSSNFGGAGMQGMGGVVGQLWGWSGLSSLQLPSNVIRPDLLPSQTILTGRIGRVSNTTLAEADIRLNPRDILTFSGIFSLLHFTSNVLTDSRQGSGIVGFNHNISPRDSVAIEATFTRVLLIDSPYNINAAEITLLYGRKITGRLSFDLGAGPIANRTYDGSQVVNGTKLRLSDLDWNARAAVHYRTRRASFTVLGARNFTAGAGVLAGTIVSSGQGTAALTLSRNWTSSLNFSASNNKQLHSSNEFNNQYSGISFTRRLGLNASIFASYDFQRQVSGTSCTGPVCGFDGNAHIFGLGLSWSPKPISIE